MFYKSVLLNQHVLEKPKSRKNDQFPTTTNLSIPAGIFGTRLLHIIYKYISIISLMTKILLIPALIIINKRKARIYFDSNL